jgi:hypothetical protein
MATNAFARYQHLALTSFEHPSATHPELLI